jgi:PhzF family phenazine biosynthesis protein
MNLKIYQVDAFTDQPFKGNPAAVCILPDRGDKFDDVWMGNLAREMNLSETAFLKPDEDSWNLRWFTPAVEVDLCGHATLASAHILYEIGLIGKKDEARFLTKSGLLTARKKKKEIELNFPATPSEEIEPLPALDQALGVKSVYQGQNIYDYLVQVESEAEVRECWPDFRALKGLGVRAVILTAKSEQDPYDFISRTFAPGAGIDEDPVTGSAHCTLGPYWGKILDKTEMLAYQASARGGTVRVVVGEDDRVYLGGKAVTVMVGELVVYSRYAIDGKDPD